MQPKPVLAKQENNERIKQIDETKSLVDENYHTLQRRKNDDSARIHRLVEQCVKQVTRQICEDVQE